VFITIRGYHLPLTIANEPDLQMSTTEFTTAKAQGGTCAESITIIFCPYHVGTRDHRVGNGPHRIRQMGIIEQLQNLGVKVTLTEITPVDDFEGEIGRSFEILRRLSKAVKDARAANSFPLVLSGNCNATVGIAAGLQGVANLGAVYFDAHDDMDTPDTHMNGYFDAMGVAMIGGQSWHRLMATVPGHEPLRLDQFVYVGLRDIDEVQRQNVAKSGAKVVWGDASAKVDFRTELDKVLTKESLKSAMVHLDLDVLDESLGKVNGYESAGGLSESDLNACLALVPEKVTPMSLVVCSFNPDSGSGDEIAAVAVKATCTFVQSLIDNNLLSRRS
jgi:arginase